MNRTRNSRNRDRRERLWSNSCKCSHTQAPCLRKGIENVLIRLGYDIEFDLCGEVPFVCLVNVHPSRVQNLLEPDILTVDPDTPVRTYLDSFGNRCARFLGTKGNIRLYNSTLIEDSGDPDPVNPSAREVPVELLPPETVVYLLNSRYCEWICCRISLPRCSEDCRADGRACRRSPIGYTSTSLSATGLPALPEQRLMLSMNAWESAAISNISPSPYAAA